MRNKKYLQNNPKTINKMAIRTYISIITVDVNWLNAPIKRLNGYKNKTLIYAAYKRLTLDLKTHTDWKWGHGKRYSMQMEIKGKLGYQYLYKTK